MNALARFQDEHGPAWAQLTGTPAYVAALSLLNVEKLESIAALTDEEIVTKGQIILADLRGHLTHENALFGLHEIKKFVFQDIGEPTYPDPTVEPAEEILDTEDAEGRGQLPLYGQPPYIPPVNSDSSSPKPKRKYRKRRRRKL